MRIGLITHIGETYGHLVRAIAVADALRSRGADVEFIAAPSAGRFVGAPDSPYRLRRVPWWWSHNAYSPTGSWLEGVRTTNRALLAELRKDPPDLVIGFPGVFSAQVARTARIPHVSVLHGPWLSPIVSTDGLTPPELRIIDIARCFFQAVEPTFAALTRDLKLVGMSYRSYLETETVFIPQPKLPIAVRDNLCGVNFIRASYGEPIHEGLDDACYVSFGSGNPCDISSIIEAASTVFSNVFVSTGKHAPPPMPPNVFARPALSSASLAPRVDAVVSHGGIGTVGTFAEHRARQLIVPTEVDQATMGVWAPRLGIADTLGLDVWTDRPPLGRRLPTLDEPVLIKTMIRLRERERPSAFSADGADQIAQSILSGERLAVGADAN